MATVKISTNVKSKEQTVLITNRYGDVRKHWSITPSSQKRLSAICENYRTRKIAKVGSQILVTTIEL